MELKKQLCDIEVPPNTFLFTADAEAMYTNIPTGLALEFISDYLRADVSMFIDVPVEALIDALRLVMTLNIFSFGDCHFKQDGGTSMVTPPAPPWATMYYACCENNALPQFTTNLIFYKCFLDDVSGLWTITDPATNAESWNRFKQRMNHPIYKLNWIISPLSKSVDFMDLTLSVKGSRIHSTLYEKPSNHHLYIPPGSCHPAGILTGMVHGGIFRIITLCTDVDDQRHRIAAFFRHLQRRGW
jgi:hypothetical protein